MSDKSKENDEYVDPTTPQECRDPLPESRKALEKLRQDIYEKLPTMGVYGRAYILLGKRIEQINLKLEKIGERKMKPREWVFLALAIIGTAAAILQALDVF